MSLSKLASLAGAAVLGIGLGVVVPAMPAQADPSASPSAESPTATESPSPSPSTSSPTPTAPETTDPAEPAPAPSDSSEPTPSPSDSSEPGPAPSPSGSEPGPAPSPSGSDPGPQPSPSESSPTTPESPAPSGSTPGDQATGGDLRKPPTGDPLRGGLPDPGTDLYPQPPFAPVAGNPSAALLQRLYDTQTEQRSLHNQIRTAEAGLTHAETAVADAKSELADARDARDRAAEGLRDSVVTIYKSGVTYRLYSVLESSDAGLMRDQAHEELARYGEATKRVDLLTDRLAGAVDSRDALLVEITSLRASLREADAAVKRLQAEVARDLAAATPGAPAAGVPTAGIPVSDGTLLWPVRGTVTSGYGNRYDPYYRVWQLHAGIDISAATGTPVVAGAGQVTQAGWNGGYGNYVCVAHGTIRGQQVTTCYGHLSRILVKAGQSVTRGATVGQVGSTGASTGPHLHFEVRVGGRPTDPQLWL